LQQNRWIIQEPDKQQFNYLLQNLKLPEVVLKILMSRGFTDTASISSFISSDKNDLLNPFLLDDMYKAVVRIKRAVENRETILIYADRDVDGITSLVILFNTIKTLGGNVNWYIPSNEGYGLSNEILDKYKALNTTLVITVDCGISSLQEVDYANSLGMQVIVTDHHEVPPVLPNAYAIIDPKKTTCNYPNKSLAGCGVSFKVSQGLMLSYGKDFDQTVSFVCVQKNETGYNAVIIDTKNNIIAEEKEISVNGFEDINKNLSTYKIVTDDKTLFENFENVEEIKVENGSLNLKEKTELILKQYIKEQKLKDRRMLAFFDETADLVALGTIADIVPLLEENRIFVKEGLNILNKNRDKRYGLSKIIDEYIKGHPKISTKTIAWNITPVLNAAGRMAKANVSAELLLADDKYKANDFFIQLKQLNVERKQLQLDNAHKFQYFFKKQCNPDTDKIFVVLAEGIAHGVTGIIASQFVKQYSKPTVLLISDGTTAVGACRSVEGFDIVAALEQTKDLLLKYGGHSQAAGFTIEISKVEEFRKRLKKIAEENLSKEMLAKKINIDCELKISNINRKTYDDLMLLEPFGAANPTPIFLIRDVEFTEVNVIGQTEEHLKLKVCQNGSFVNALFWNGAKYRDLMQYKRKFNVLFNIELNRDSVQIIIVDISAI